MPRSVRRRIHTLLPTKVKIRRGRRSLGPGPYLHFLHVPKTGGTALRHVFEDRHLETAFDVMIHAHEVTLRDLPRSDLFLFTVRDPVARFTSAFNSRLRQGLPRWSSPWTDAEREVFATYTTPNDLAVCLASRDSRRRQQAEESMRSVEFFRRSYWYWFGDERTLRRAASRILWVGRQEVLADDVATLSELIGATTPIRLPSDPVEAHRQPPGMSTALDDEATDALRRWYADDFHFMDVVGELRGWSGPIAGRHTAVR